MSELLLQGVSRSFGGLLAVQNVALRVQGGRITGLVGPNGAGKTTLVNLITGFLKLSEGQVLLDGVDIAALPPHEIAAAGVARTFQQGRLLNETTITENIRVALEQRSEVPLLASILRLPSARRERRAADARIEDLLGQFGLMPYADRLPTEVSYGHQRRVEIARALAIDPAILVLDEPAAGLNDTEAAQLSVSLRALAEQGLGVFLIEHNMNMVMNLCDDIYVLESGELIAHGTPAEIQRDEKVLQAYLGENHCSR